MAEEKKVEKIVLEREYNVPLRSAFIRVPKYRKSNRAVIGLREFIMKHMKADSLSSVKISKQVNEFIWERGMRTPPHHVKVKCTKYETYVAVSLIGEADAKKETPKKEAKAEAAEKPAKEKADVKAKPKAKKEEDTKLESFSKKEAKVEDKKEKPAKKAEAKKE